MTNIVFLNALLRNKYCQDVKPLEEFLELEKAQLLKQSVPLNPKDGGKEYAFMNLDSHGDGVNTAAIATQHSYISFQTGGGEGNYPNRQDDATGTVFCSNQ